MTTSPWRHKFHWTLNLKSARRFNLHELAAQWHSMAQTSLYSCKLDHYTFEWRKVLGIISASTFHLCCVLSHVKTGCQIAGLFHDQQFHKYRTTGLCPIPFKKWKSIQVPILQILQESQLHSKASESDWMRFCAKFYQGFDKKWDCSLLRKMKEILFTHHNRDCQRVDTT